MLQFGPTIYLVRLIPRIIITNNVVLIVNILNHIVAELLPFFATNDWVKIRRNIKMSKVRIEEDVRNKSNAVAGNYHLTNNQSLNRIFNLQYKCG